MKPKTLLIAVILLAALSAAAWFFNRPVPPPSARDPRLNQPLLTPAAAENAASLSLTSKGATVTLARPSAAAGWVVVSNHDLPADFAKLASLVQNLSDTRVERFVTSSPDRLARLGFPDTMITVAGASGQSLLSLTLGKDADGGGRYLRFNEEKKAYLARIETVFDADSRNWTDTALLRFSAADIAKVAFDFPSPLTVSRANANTPFATDAPPPGRRLKTDTVTSLLSTLANLRFTETTATDDPKATGARAAARTVTLTTFDGKTLVFALGRRPEHAVARTDAAHAAPVEFFIHDPTPAPATLLGSLTEKVPPGPVFAFITHSDDAAPINTLMKKRAFQIGDYVLTSLPADSGALFEPIPPPPAAPVASTPPAAPSQTP